MKLLCYGDSNTFGYDPRDFFGARYEKENRWVDILQANTGWDVINAGANGRKVPRHTFELTAFQQLIAQHTPDLIIVMLGTNDLLQGTDPQTIAARMETFLEQISGSVLLIAPPSLQRGAWVQEDSVVLASRSLSKLFYQVAENLQISFADSQAWEIPLTFDGVHFSEAGHRKFAAQLRNVLS